ncbi:hypothetical protein COD11_19640 [Bacillus sp. AFS040349]|nr:hypothetical protein COD11_19640 [Bacillus sp. AFS040349]
MYLFNTNSSIKNLKSIMYKKSKNGKDDTINLLDCEEINMIKKFLPAVLLIFFTFVGFSVYFLYQLSIFTLKVMVYTI